MPKVKVAEATGPVLDWMVAKAEGRLGKWLDLGQGTSAEDVVLIGQTLSVYQGGRPDYTYYAPSTDWAQGGPIIKRIKGFQFKQWLECKPDTCCEAHIHNYEGDWIQFGPTPLIATMRCYVASKLGDEVDIPEELG